MTSTTVLSSTATADRRVATSVALTNVPAGASTTVLSISKSRSAGVHEIQLLMLLVVGIGVIVLSDEPVAGELGRVAVDAERGDPEVVADRLPVSVGMRDRGRRDLGERAGSWGFGHDEPRRSSFWLYERSRRGDSNSRPLHYE